MAGSAKAPLSQLPGAALEPATAAGELLAGELVDDQTPELVPELLGPAVAPGLLQRNLLAEGDRLAARAASPATRRQYRSISASPPPALA